MQGPFFATVKMDAPFQVNNPTVNATELYEKDRRHQQMVTTLKGLLILTVLTVLIAAFVIARKARAKWPVVTILLYGVFFVTLILPFLWAVFVWFGKADSSLSDWSDLSEMYTTLYGKAYTWPFWLLFAGMILAQGCLLIIPVRTSHERPKPQRGIWLTAIAAGFLYTVLLFGTFMSLMSAIMGDDWPQWMQWLLWVALPVNWMVWVVIFRLFAKRVEPKSYIRRIVKWLMRGSILELLVAVPSHIIVRHKDVCCAHMTSAAGIAAGPGRHVLRLRPRPLLPLHGPHQRQKTKYARTSRQTTPQNPGRGIIDSFAEYAIILALI